MPGVRQGQTLRLLLKASDPLGRYIREGTAVAFARGREYPAGWVERERGYVALIDTANWEPGTYTVTGEVRGVTEAGPVRGFSEPQEFTVVPAAIIDPAS